MIMGKWGRQSPTNDPSLDPPPPPLPMRKMATVTRQSSFSKLGSIITSTKNGIIKRQPSGKHLKSTFRFSTIIWIHCQCKQHVILQWEHEINNKNTHNIKCAICAMRMNVGMQSSSAVHVPCTPRWDSKFYFIIINEHINRWTWTSLMRAMKSIRNSNLWK